MQLSWMSIFSFTTPNLHLTKIMPSLWTEEKALDMRRIRVAGVLFLSEAFLVFGGTISVMAIAVSGTAGVFIVYNAFLRVWWHEE